jgi:hypothetical protein
MRLGLAPFFRYLFVLLPPFPLLSPPPSPSISAQFQRKREGSRCQRAHQCRARRSLRWRRADHDVQVCKGQNFYECHPRAGNYTPTDPHTHTPTHPHTHPHTHTPTHPPTDPHTHTPTHPNFHPFTHPSDSERCALLGFSFSSLLPSSFRIAGDTPARFPRVGR